MFRGRFDVVTAHISASGAGRCQHRWRRRGRREGDALGSWIPARHLTELVRQTQARRTIAAFVGITQRSNGSERLTLEKSHHRPARGCCHVVNPDGGHGYSWSANGTTQCLYIVCADRDNFHDHCLECIRRLQILDVTATAYSPAKRLRSIQNLSKYYLHTISVCSTFSEFLG